MSKNKRYVPFKGLSLCPEFREEECTNHSFRWSGKMPCTGERVCVYCGARQEDVEKEIDTEEV